MSFADHPVLKGLSMLVVVVGVVIACIGLYIFFDHLNQGLKDKRALDKEWMKLDRDGHQAIVDQCKAAQVEVKLLAARLDGDGSILYRLGLRDGMALCRSQQEE